MSWFRRLRASQMTGKLGGGGDVGGEEGLTRECYRESLHIVRRNCPVALGVSYANYCPKL